jgi:hypothetical protein
MRRPCTFKGTDATRAVKVILAAGLVIECVEVNRDGLNIFVRHPNDQGRAVVANDWDELLDGKPSASLR